MDEKQIYSKVLELLYEGLKIEKHNKFKNDKLGERNYLVGNLYPDVLMINKETENVDFIVEIVIGKKYDSKTILEKWKPLSEIGSVFYLLVPNNEKSKIEKTLIENNLKIRVGTYEIKNNEANIKF
jgi:hypothetical protein